MFNSWIFYKLKSNSTLTSKIVIHVNPQWVSLKGTKTPSRYLHNEFKEGKGREKKRREEVRVACKLCGRTADRTWWQSYRATNNRRRVRTNSSTEYGDTTGFFGSEGADFRNRDKDRGSQMLSVDNNILTWLTNRSLIYWHRGIF